MTRSAGRADPRGESSCPHQSKELKMHCDHPEQSQTTCHAPTMQNTKLPKKPGQNSSVKTTQKRSPRKRTSVLDIKPKPNSNGWSQVQSLKDALTGYKPAKLSGGFQAQQQHPARGNTQKANMVMTCVQPDVLQHHQKSRARRRNPRPHSRI